MVGTNRTDLGDLRLGAIESLVPERPDDPRALLDACLAFYTLPFRDLQSYDAVLRELGDTKRLDFHLERKKVPTVSRIKDGAAVYRSDSGRLKEYTFDRGDPSGSAHFFYQFRSNLVHRGKGAIRDVERLSETAHGLLEALKALWEIYGLPFEDEWSIREIWDTAIGNR